MNKKTLRELQLTEVEILNELDRICKQNDITYYLIGGTLLGAVRHEGFIPWDDDLDVVMPRKDYEKFIKVCSNQLNKKYVLQSYRNTTNYWLPFAKIRKKNTIFLEKDIAHMNTFHGIFIDIFPLDMSHSTGDSFSVRARAKIFNYTRYLIGNKVGLYKHTNHENIKNTMLTRILTRVFTSEFLLKLQQKMIVIHILAPRYYVNFGSRYGVKKQTIPIDWYEPAVLIEFEGNKYPAPSHYKKILERIYGKKYMELPPENKRVTHNPLMISFDTKS